MYKSVVQDEIEMTLTSRLCRRLRKHNGIPLSCHEASTAPQIFFRTTASLSIYVSYAYEMNCVRSNVAGTHNGSQVRCGCNYRGGSNMSKTDGRRPSVSSHACWLRVARGSVSTRSTTRASQLPRYGRARHMPRHAFTASPANLLL